MRTTTILVLLTLIWFKPAFTQGNATLRIGQKPGGEKDQIELSWQSVSERGYRLETTQELSFPAVWVPLAGWVSAGGPVFWEGRADDTFRFYRVGEFQPPPGGFISDFKAWEYTPLVAVLRGLDELQSCYDPSSCPEDPEIEAWLERYQERWARFLASVRQSPETAREANSQLSQRIADVLPNVLPVMSEGQRRLICWNVQALLSSFREEFGLLMYPDHDPDGDGVHSHEDNDDDGDGIADAYDLDDENSGIPDDLQWWEDDDRDLDEDGAEDRQDPGWRGLHGFSWSAWWDDNPPSTVKEATEAPSFEEIVTAPVLAAGTKNDRDGDGVSDARETAGYSISVLFVCGQATQTVIVTTNPDDPDTDGDGLNDGAEHKKTDGESTDGDGDGLSDFDEIRTHQTSAISVDTDLDGIEDADEIALGLDPSDRDTDRDGQSDYDEIQNNSNPLVADIPRISVQLEGGFNLIMNASVTEAGQTTTNTKSATLTDVSTRSQQMDYFNIKTTEDQAFHIDASVNANYPPGYVEASVNTSYDWNASVATDHTTQWQEDVTKKATEQYEKFHEETKSSSVTYQDGTVSTSIRIVNNSGKLIPAGGNARPGTYKHNIPSLGVRVKSFAVRAYKVDPASSCGLTYFATLAPQGFPADGIIVNPGGGSVAFGCENTGVQSGLILDLMGNLGSVVFRADDTIVLTDPVGGVDFNTHSKNIQNNCVQLLIDYGDGDVYHYFVATNKRWNDDKSVRALTLCECLEIIGLDYEAKEVTFDNGETANILWRLGGVEANPLPAGGEGTRPGQYWYIYGTAQGLGKGDFPGVEVKARDKVGFYYNADTDGDGGFDATERMWGTSPAKGDTDGDNLPDPLEARGVGNLVEGTYTRGWICTAYPQGQDRVYPHARFSDLDRDGLSDSQEAPASWLIENGIALDPQRGSHGYLHSGTDPRNPDTDGDGISDGKEVFGDPDKGIPPSDPLSQPPPPPPPPPPPIQYIDRGNWAGNSEKLLRGDKTTLSGGTVSSNRQGLVVEGPNGTSGEYIKAGYYQLALDMSISGGDSQTDARTKIATVQIMSDMPSDPRTSFFVVPLWWDQLNGRNKHVFFFRIKEDASRWAFRVTVNAADQRTTLSFSLAELSSATSEEFKLSPFSNDWRATHWWADDLSHGPTYAGTWRSYGAKDYGGGSDRGGFLYGPYTKIPAGCYRVVWRLSSPYLGYVYFDVTSNNGARPLLRHPKLSVGRLPWATTISEAADRSFYFCAPETLEGVEFRIWPDRGEKLLSQKGSGKNDIAAGWVILEKVETVSDATFRDGDTFEAQSISPLDPNMCWGSATEKVGNWQQFRKIKAANSQTIPMWGPYWPFAAGRYDLGLICHREGSGYERGIGYYQLYKYEGDQTLLETEVRSSLFSDNNTASYKVTTHTFSSAASMIELRWKTHIQTWDLVVEELVIWNSRY